MKYAEVSLMERWMKTINFLIDSGITEISKKDVMEYFEITCDYQDKAIFEYLDCEVTAVAGLFNVKFPAKKYTRKEIKEAREFELNYGLPR